MYDQCILAKCEDLINGSQTSLLNPSNDDDFFPSAYLALLVDKHSEHIIFRIYRMKIVHLFNEKLPIR